MVAAVNGVAAGGGVSLALLGDRIPADIAAQRGMIWMAVPDDQAMSEVDAIAARLATGPPVAFAKIKTVLEAADYNRFEEQLELERRVQTVLGDTLDTREGMVAFPQKREPKFTGT